MPQSISVVDEGAKCLRSGRHKDLTRLLQNTGGTPPCINVFDVAMHSNKQIGRVHRQNLLQLFNSPEILQFGRLLFVTELLLNLDRFGYNTVLQISQIGHCGPACDIL